jgi:hypothetical protein
VIDSPSCVAASTARRLVAAHLDTLWAHRGVGLTADPRHRLSRLAVALASDERYGAPLARTSGAVR